MLSFEAWFFEVATFLAAFLGTTSLDAHITMLNICAFTFLSVPFALGIAASIRVGHSLGAGKPAEAKATAKVAVLLVLWRVLATSGGGDAPADSSFLEELDLDEAEQARLKDIEALIKENPDEAVAGFLGLVRWKEPAA